MRLHLLFRGWYPGPFSCDGPHRVGGHERTALLRFGLCEGSLRRWCLLLVRRRRGQGHRSQHPEGKPTPRTAGKAPTHSTLASTPPHKQQPLWFAPTPSSAQPRKLRGHELVCGLVKRSRRPARAALAECAGVCGADQLRAREMPNGRHFAHHGLPNSIQNNLSVSQILTTFESQYLILRPSIP